MLDQYERWVHFYTLTLQSVPLNAPAFSILECVRLLEKRARENKCFKAIEKKTASIRISELRVDETKGIATFLFQYSDSKVSDPAFSDLELGAVREEPKLDGEGIAVSAHAVLSLVPVQGKQFDYLLLLEDAPGVGRTKIAPFLNTELRNVLTRDYIDPDDGKTKPCHPNVSLGHHISQTLRQDLESGELRFLELIKDVTSKELDEDPQLLQMSNTIRVRVSPNTKGQEAVGFINRVKNHFAKQDYKKMKVVYKRPEGKQRTVDVSTFREDAGDALFGKMEPFSMSYRLPQCAEQINEDVVLKMLELK